MPPVLWAEVLTPTYCEDIGLPWAVVFAFKDRWRRMTVRTRWEGLTEQSQSHMVSQNPRRTKQNQSPIVLKTAGTA